MLDEGWIVWVEGKEIIQALEECGGIVAFTDHAVKRRSNTELEWFTV